MLGKYIILVFVFAITACKGKNSGTETLFIKKDTETTGISFTNKIWETEAFNIQDYLYFYNGGGIASGDLNNDGLIDIFFTSNQDHEALFLNKGGLQFEDIWESAGIGGKIGLQTWTNGATMVDINDDGFLDIYVCELNGYLNIKGRNRLYINNGDLTFTESAKEYGLDFETYSQQAAFFDADNDGDLDFYLVNQSVHTPYSYKRSETRSQIDSLAGDRFYCNEDGHFLDRTVEAGIYSGAMGYGLSVNIADFNLDGFADIYVCNDFHENDYLYYNNGNGTFRESITKATKHNSTFSMGASIGDYNNDQWPDIFTLDMRPDKESIYKTSAGTDPSNIYEYKLDFGYHYQYSRNMLQLNMGTAENGQSNRFSEIAQIKGVSATDWSWSASFADLNNDGFKDLFITNGIPKRPNNLDFTNFTFDELKKKVYTDLEIIKEMPEGTAKNHAFQNNNGSFTDNSANWGLDHKGCTNGALTVDLDNDGDLDIVVNNLNEPSFIYQNMTIERKLGNFLKFQLVGSAKNKAGIGATATLYSKGNVQSMYNKLTDGWLSSSYSNTLHFGLGNIENIDSVRVIWPDGKQEIRKDIMVNDILVFDYRSALDSNYLLKKPSKNRLLTDITVNSGISFAHMENKFNELSREKLILGQLSKEGPKIAVADINGDGLDDFYIGGAKGQAGELYLQNKSGQTIFTKCAVPDFEKHYYFEDTDAIFIDWEGDGDLDLYVVSGGDEYSPSKALKDRVYINNGKGGYNFLDNIDWIDESTNGSCVVLCDPNEDGLMDIFIGNRSVPENYGKSGRSRVLINKGNGKYSESTSNYLNDNGYIGMVSGAVWIAKKKQLVIVGEWMPICIYEYNGANMYFSTVENSSGLYKTIATTDFDGDGELEILVGNIGCNTILEADVKRPVKLYLKDFDVNGQLDPIISYNKEGEDWPYASRDLLASQLPRIKTKFNTYKDYANSPMDKVFEHGELQQAERHTVVNTSSCYLSLSSKGEYVMKPFPENIQYSSIYAFASDDFTKNGRKDIIAGGNDYGLSPTIGRTDASYGDLIYISDSTMSSHSLLSSGVLLDGALRSLKVLKGKGNQKYLLAGFNNAKPKLFEY